MFRKADRATGVSTIVKNMRQGARANVDKEVTFKLPPESQPSAFVFSATGGKTPFDKSTITKMFQKVRAARAERTGKEEQISSHTERTSMCYWLDQVMTSSGDEATCNKVREEVAAFCESFPLPH